MTKEQACRPRSCHGPRPVAVSVPYIFRFSVGILFGLRTISCLTLCCTWVAPLNISTCTGPLASPCPSCVICGKLPDSCEPVLPGLCAWGERAVSGSDCSNTCEDPRTVLGIALVGIRCWMSGLMVFSIPVTWVATVPACKTISAAHRCRTAGQCLLSTVLSRHALNLFSLWPSHFLRGSAMDGSLRPLPIS